MSNIESPFLLGRKAQKKTAEDYDYVNREENLDCKFFWNS
jgi:hypothetical protein